MLVDLHVHSNHTEGVEASAADVIEKARAAGLDGVVFTDRHATAHAQALIDLGAANDFAVFVGLEITTDHGVLLCFVPQIDEFMLNEEWRSLKSIKTPPAQAVIDHINARGGAVIAAYPYDLDMPWALGDRLFELKGLNGIEVYVPRLPWLKNAFAVEAALAAGLPCAGGTDLRKLDDLGKVATLFAEDLSTQAEFVETLKAGAYWAVALGEDIDAMERDLQAKARARREADRESRGRDGDRGPRRGGRDGGRGGRDGGRGGRDGGRGGRDGARGGRGGRDGGRGRPQRGRRRD